MELITKTAEELAEGKGRNQTLFCYNKFTIWEITKYGRHYHSVTQYFECTTVLIDIRGNK